MLEPFEFHWRDGFTFQRLSDGAVRVRQYADTRTGAVFQEFVIPGAEWVSIIAAVAPERGSTQDYYRATAAHHPRADSLA